MAFKCKIGLHSWNGCKCSNCGKIRNEQHDWSRDCEKCSKCGKIAIGICPTCGKKYSTWENKPYCYTCNKYIINFHNWIMDCEKCSKCGKPTTNFHKWIGCRCIQCGKTRDEQHDWSKDCEKCSICNKTRSNKHDWSKDCENCSKCNKTRSNQHVWPDNSDTCSICQISKPTIEWVKIPAGSFLMGSPINEIDRSDDETQHKVILNAFRMSKYAITFEQYDAYCDTIGKMKPNDEGWGRGKRPVINVSWEDANSFAQSIGCRLPTEAEWEYACRAGTTTPFNTGNKLTATQANYYLEGDYRQQTLPVGSYNANAFGLYDMHGNVWEWCSDWLNDYSTTIEQNPQGPSSGTIRSRRGGCWSSGAIYCRSANRLPFILSIPPQDYRDHSTGFRIVSDEKE